MRTSILLAGFCGAALIAAPAGAQYQVGHEWNRHNEFRPGLAPGSSAGNPSPDGEGANTWQYEWATGSALGSSTPWFSGPTTLAVWDDNWWDIGTGAWVRADNVNPPLFHDRLTHNVHRSQADAIPMIRWINPINDQIGVSLQGNLNVLWSGHQFVGAPMDVDVVIAVNNFASGVTTPLLATTLSKPTPSNSVGDSLDVPVNLQNVELNPGDSLIFSLRGRDAVTGNGRWLVLRDDVSITLTHLPTPGTLALIGLAGLVAARRRR